MFAFQIHFIHQSNLTNGNSVIVARYASLALTWPSLLLKFHLSFSASKERDKFPWWKAWMNRFHSSSSLSGRSRSAAHGHFFRPVLQKTSFKTKILWMWIYFINSGEKIEDSTRPQMGSMPRNVWIPLPTCQHSSYVMTGRLFGKLFQMIDTWDTLLPYCSQWNASIPMQNRALQSDLAHNDLLKKLVCLMPQPPRSQGSERTSYDSRWNLLVSRFPAQRKLQSNARILDTIVAGKENMDIQ